MILLRRYECLEFCEEFRLYLVQYERAPEVLYRIYVGIPEIAGLDHQETATTRQDTITGRQNTTITGR